MSCSNGNTTLFFLRCIVNLINVLLSYSYAILAGECLCAVAAAGLDPRQGFLHKPRAGRPALALDLMEPFRPLIADQAILSGINLGQISVRVFETDASGMRFAEDGRRTIIKLLEKRLSSSIALLDRMEPLSYRAAIGVQAQDMARALRTDTSFKAMERA